MHRGSHGQGRPRALDLFCCEGGVSEGLRRAGFDVVGVDIDPQPRYPFEFHQADALTFPLDGFDFIWASPPCQRFSRATPKAARDSHPDLIEPIRDRLLGSGKPWVIENVPGAPITPMLKLHGAMFGLPMHRDRWFESNVFLLAPYAQRHARDGRARNFKTSELICMAGSFTGAPRAREALGMPWASRRGLAQCIPPQYAECIGRPVISACLDGASN